MSQQSNPNSGFSGPSSSRSAPAPLLPITSDNRPAIERLVEAYQNEVKRFGRNVLVRIDAPERGDEHYAIRHSQRVAGFIFMHAWPDGIQLCELYVEPARRRIGIGTRAIDAVKSMLRARGLLGISLKVERRNKGAVTFFDRQGFAYRATHQEPGGSPEDIMAWPAGAYGGIARR